MLYRHHICNHEHESCSLTSTHPCSYEPQTVQLTHLESAPYHRARCFLVTGAHLTSYLRSRCLSPRAAVAMRRALEGVVILCCCWHQCVGQVRTYMASTDTPCIYTFVSCTFPIYSCVSIHAVYMHGLSASGHALRR